MLEPAVTHGTLLKALDGLPYNLFELQPPRNEQMMDRGGSAQSRWSRLSGCTCHHHSLTFGICSLLSATSFSHSFSHPTASHDRISHRRQRPPDEADELTPLRVAWRRLARCRHRASAERAVQRCLLAAFSACVVVVGQSEGRPGESTAEVLPWLRQSLALI